MQDFKVGCSLWRSTRKRFGTNTIPPVYNRHELDRVQARSVHTHTLMTLGFISQQAKLLFGLVTTPRTVYR